MINNVINTDLDSVISLSDKDFFSNIAFIMQIALVKDLSLYTYIIDKMYEVCERDKEVLEEILSACEKDKKLILSKEDLDANKVSALSFGYTIGEALSESLGDKFYEGEYLSLGCVAEGFIAYKKNWLTKEEYYELRDMFVPFYLPISVEMLDIDKVLDTIKSSLDMNEDGKYTLALIKKIGKSVIDKTVTIDEIRDAINELNFDEAW